MKMLLGFLFGVLAAVVFPEQMQAVAHIIIDAGVRVFDYAVVELSSTDYRGIVDDN